MTPDEFNEIVQELGESLESLFDPGVENPVAHLAMKTSTGKPMSLMIGLGERAEQIDSFADAMGLKEVAVTGWEDIDEASPR